MSSDLPIQVITYLFIGATASFFVVATLLTMFDIQIASKLQQLPSIPHYKKRKKIALIITTHNNANDIEACLQNIYTLQLRSLEVLVVDRGSSDDTVAQIKLFQKNHPKFALKTLYKRNFTSTAQVLKQTLKKLNDPQVIMHLPVAAILTKQHIYTIQKIFNTGQPVESFVLPNTTSITTSYVSLLHSYGQMTSYLVKKCAAYVGIKISATSQDSTVYNALNKINDAPQLTLYSYVIYLRSKARTDLSFSRKWTTYVLNFIWLLIVPYFVYVAVHYENMQMLLYSFGLVTGWLFIASIATAGLKIIERMNFFLSLPVAYVLLYIRSGIVTLSLLARLKKTN